VWDLMVVTWSPASGEDDDDDIDWEEGWVSTVFLLYNLLKILFTKCLQYNFLMVVVQKLLLCVAACLLIFRYFV
jgi:hypothetical protein